MSATNKTANYDLPQFVADDKPSWLGDWNHTMEVIDGAIYQAQATADSATTAGSDLAQRVTEAEGDIDVLQASDLTQNTQISGNTGSINTINSLIGNGEPTTTDKTLIGAINEINAKIPEQGTVKAEDVEYDNTTSGLTADDVQEAIDEVEGRVDTAETAITANTGSLVVGANRFYFDVQNGEYGYNTSASRGADTFHPFKSTPVDLDVTLTSRSNNTSSLVFNVMDEYAYIVCTNNSAIGTLEIYQNGTLIQSITQGTPYVIDASQHSNEEFVLMSTDGNNGTIRYTNTNPSA